MKKNIFILGAFVLAMMITNCVLLYQNFEIQKTVSDMAETHFSKLQSAISTLQSLAGAVSSKLNSNALQSAFGDRTVNSEFSFISFDGEYTLLNLNISFSRVEDGEEIYLVLHEVESNSFQKVDLMKRTGSYYGAQIRLSAEKEYGYQISFERNGVITSSQEYRIPNYYYNPHLWEITPTFSINSTKSKRVPAIEFKLNAFSKPYFKEFQISSASVVVYKNGIALKELPFHIYGYNSESNVAFEIEEGSIDNYDFYIHVEYKGGFEKQEKINKVENQRWKQVLDQYLWFSNNNL